MDSTIDLPQRTEVAIVGAGPTGLALAVTLAAAGVDFVILDRLAEGANTSRAAVVHARTLEVLDELGAAEELIARGIQVTALRGPRRLAPAADRPVRRPAHALPVHADGPPVRDRERAAGPAAGTRRRRPPPVRGHLRRPGRGRRHAHHEHRGDPARRLRRRRRRHAQRRPGGSRASGSPAAPTPSPSSSPTSLMDWAPGRSEVSLTFGAAGLTVVAPLPGGHYRIVATVDDAPADARPRASCSGCWTSARPARPGSPSWPGPPASASTTGSPTTTGPAACCSPATPPTCTAPPAARA